MNGYRFSLGGKGRLAGDLEAMLGHTEGIILSNLEDAGLLGPGRTLIIDGIRPPYTNCQGLMRKYSEIYNMNIMYLDALRNIWAWANGLKLH